MLLSVGRKALFFNQTEELVKGKNKPASEKGICLKRKLERRKAEEAARKEAHLLLSTQRQEDQQLGAELAQERQRRDTRLKIRGLIRAGLGSDSNPAFA